MEEAAIDSGFLIVKTFHRLFRDYSARYSLSRDLYAMPRIDRKPEDYWIQYRGLDRDALDPYTDSEVLAEIRMAELEKEGKCRDGFLFNLDDIRSVLDFLEDKKDYEIIWTKTIQSRSIPPEGYSTVGFEPTYFTGDHFSAACDCMLFPRWHGTDKEGTLFIDHFRKLNQDGLFNTEEEASEFLKYYLSYEWTETGEYEIAEVFVKK
jgi:hypothetical protein